MRRRRVENIMTTGVIAVVEDTPIKEIAWLLADRGISAVPVVDTRRRVVGVVSEADLIAKESVHANEEYTGTRRHHVPRRVRAKARALVASDAMSSPAVTIGPDMSVVEAARLMDRQRVKRLPVVDPEGRLVGVVSRRDLVCLLLRPDDELAEEIRDEVFDRALGLPPMAVRVGVQDGVATVTGQLQDDQLVRIAALLVSQVDGVIGVVNRLSTPIRDAEARQFKRASAAVNRSPRI